MTTHRSFAGRAGRQWPPDRDCAAQPSTELWHGIACSTWGVQQVQQAADAQPLERARDARPRRALAQPAAHQAVNQRALAHIGEAHHHRAHRPRLQAAPRARLVDARGLAQRRLGDLRRALALRCRPRQPSSRAPLPASGMPSTTVRLQAARRARLVDVSNFARPSRG